MMNLSDWPIIAEPTTPVLVDDGDAIVDDNPVSYIGLDDIMDDSPSTSGRQAHNSPREA